MGHFEIESTPHVCLGNAEEFSRGKTQEDLPWMRKFDLPQGAFVYLPHGADCFISVKRGSDSLRSKEPRVFKLLEPIVREQYVRLSYVDDSIEVSRNIVKEADFSHVAMQVSRELDEDIDQLALALKGAGCQMVDVCVFTARSAVHIDDSICCFTQFFMYGGQKIEC
jgi:hypothetical protein